jgi:hypothetical protein
VLSTRRGSRLAHRVILAPRECDTSDAVDMTQDGSCAVLSKTRTPTHWSATTQEFTWVGETLNPRIPTRAASMLTAPRPTAANPAETKTKTETETRTKTKTKTTTTTKTKTKTKTKTNARPIAAEQGDAPVDTTHSDIHPDDTPEAGARAKTKTKTKTAATKSKPRSKKGRGRVCDSDMDTDSDLDEYNLLGDDDLYAEDLEDIRAASAEDAAASSPAPVRPSTSMPHWVYTQALSAHVKSLSVKTKRKIYVAMRQKPEVAPNSFLPHQGLNVCEFAAWQILSDNPRRSTA